MPGDEQRQAGFIVMTTLEDVVPDDHPLRAIRTMVDAAFEKMSPELEALYASGGRPSIAPEHLLRAQLIEILYAIPSERRLVAMSLSSTPRASKNRARLLTSEIAEAFFAAIRGQSEAHKLLSREHFSVDGTLIEAVAALKSLRPIEESESEEPRPAAGVTGTSTSTASAAATPAIARPTTPRPSWRAKALARRPSSATPAMP